MGELSPVEDSISAGAGHAASQRLWGVKYGTERILAGIALLALTPLLTVFGVLVKLTSRGPVLYTEERLGRDGKPFRIYKFRTMHVGVSQVLGEDGKVLTLKDDPRVTTLGKFLRLGFDELPQLFNIVKGEMCLIGPRPDVVWEKDRYTGREGTRLRVLPGITGLSQVVGGRTMNNAQNYELDVLYVEQSTWKTDLLILLVTVPYSLGLERIGAAVFRDFVRSVECLGDVCTQQGGDTVHGSEDNLGTCREPVADPGRHGEQAAGPAGGGG